MRIIRVKRLKSGRLPARVYRLDRGSSVALMNSQTGQMMGRVRETKKDDSTKVFRIKKGYDVDGDGRADSGQIYGRTKAIRSSKRARGYVRKL